MKEAAVCLEALLRKTQRTEPAEESREPQEETESLQD